MGGNLENRNIFQDFNPASSFNAGKLALLERDLFFSGDGLPAFDTDTGYKWLDITVTIGISYVEVLKRQYMTALSFRLARLQELTTPSNNAGGSGDCFIPINSKGDFDGFPIAEDYDAAMLLIGLLGFTSYIVGRACDLSGQDWQIGYHSEQVVGGIQHAAEVNPFYNSPTYGNAGAIWLDAAESVPDRTAACFGCNLARIYPPLFLSPSAYSARLLLVWLVLIIEGKQHEQSKANHRGF